MAEVQKARQEEFEIDGVTYVLQHPGHRGKTRMMDASMDKDGKLVMEKFFEQLMKNVVVSPPEAKGWEYWDHNDNFDEVMEKAGRFLTGPKREA